MWSPNDDGRWFFQHPSFNQPIPPPTAEVCDPPLVCFRVNQQYIPYMLGALTQLAQPSTWLVSTDADRQVALQRATDLIAEVAAAMPCEPTPYQPPGVDTNQQACNIAGYLANVVIREAMLQGVQAAQQTLGIFSFAIKLISIIPGIGIVYPIFAAAVIQFLTSIVSGNLNDYEFALGDSSLWSQVACAIYNAIKADGDVTQANFPAVQTALCSLTYPLSDVKTTICDWVQGLGAQNVINAQQPGVLASYTCDCVGNVVSGPPGLPALQASGTARILIAAGQAVGTAAISLLKAFGAPPILVPGGDNPIMIPSFTSVTTSGFTVAVEAPRPVDVDTYVDVDWIALPPGEN